METEPFTLSNQRCLWQMCGQRADLRILRAGAQYCREHSLFMWSIVDEELRESRMTLEQVKAKDAENKAKEQRKIAVREQAKETAEEKRNRPGYVYYLRIGELFKIGFASNLEQRLASYPPGTQLLAVEDGSLKLEPSDTANSHIHELPAANGTNRTLHSTTTFKPSPKTVDTHGGTIRNGKESPRSRSRRSSRDTGNEPARMSGKKSDKVGAALHVSFGQGLTPLLHPGARLDLSMH
ncbi:GIY-YIG nuclease family protein [Rhodococcus erythropolis]|uniref:GIY-YIG nuclease family protein n=1 Tax=Rhodococcus erythropolis TaxID=1833 RepID=UPI00339EB53B